MKKEVFEILISVVFIVVVIIIDKWSIKAGRKADIIKLDKVNKMIEAQMAESNNHPVYWTHNNLNCTSYYKSFLSKDKGFIYCFSQHAPCRTFSSEQELRDWYVWDWYDDERKRNSR